MEYPQMPPGITKKLDQPIDEGRVKSKKVEGRPDASYLETYDVINTANAIFGYGQWGTQIVQLQWQEVGGKSVCIATLQLDVAGGMSRQDVGVMVAAQAKGKELSPQALETAIKGAVSDALKRAFRHYGAQFGNDLYAKENDKAAPRPLRKPAKGQPATAKAKKVDAVTAYWQLVNAKNVDQGFADELVRSHSGDFEKALVALERKLQNEIAG